MSKDVPLAAAAKDVPPAAKKDGDRPNKTSVSVPSTTTQSAGRSLFSLNLRSITMSRLAFDCYRRFNKKQEPQDLEELPVLEKTESMKEVIEALGGYEFEHNLTKDLCRTMEEVTCGDNKPGVTPHHQWNIAVPRSSPVKADLVFVEDMKVPKNKSVSRKPVALFEFNLVKARERDPRIKQKKCVDRWFAKFGQGLKYLNYMTPRAAAPTRKRKSGDSNVSYATDDATNEQDDDSSKEPGESQKFGYLRLEGPALFFTVSFVLGLGKAPNEMLIGCFIAEPKPEEGIGEFSNVRVALLYRKQVCGSGLIFDAWCEALKHICWFKVHHSNDVDRGWRYLGPHCALVQDKGVKRVYRAYDSRPRRIARSSAVYENDVVGLSAEVLLNHEDGGHADDGEEDDDKFWLFRFCGGVKVISVPFVAGTHVPSSVGQLLQIAHYLLSLHGVNVVHGDIRLLNMVFRETGSVLIDFDFAGSADDPSTIYPPHYKQVLMDGRRPGVEGEGITKEDDVESLIQVCLLVTGINRNDVMVEPSLQKLIAALRAYDGSVLVTEKALAKCLLNNSKLSEARDHTGSGDPVSPV